MMTRSEMIRELARIVTHLDAGETKDCSAIHKIYYTAGEPGVITAGLLRSLLAELRRVEP